MRFFEMVGYGDGDYRHRLGLGLGRKREPEGWYPLDSISLFSPGGLDDLAGSFLWYFPS